MFKISLISIFLTISTLYFWTFTKIPTEQSFIILGQAHFALAYYYIYRKNGFSFKKTLLFGTLFCILFYLIYTKLLNPTMFGIFVSYLFLIHTILDEFSFRSIQLTSTHVISIAISALPWMLILIKFYYNLSALLLFILASLLTIPWSLYVIYKNLKEKKNTNLLVLSMTTIILTISILLLSNPVIEFLFAGIILYHIFVWYVGTLIKENYSMRFLSIVFLSITPFLWLYLSTKINTELKIPILHINYYFLWAFIHILVTFRYYENSRTYLLNVFR